MLSLEEESLTVIGVGSRPRPKTSSEVSARDRFKFIPYHERFYLIFFFVNLPIGFNSFGDRVERSENIGKRRWDIYRVRERCASFSAQRESRSTRLFKSQRSLFLSFFPYYFVDSHRWLIHPRRPRRPCYYCCFCVGKVQRTVAVFTPSPSPSPVFIIR